MDGPGVLNLLEKVANNFREIAYLKKCNGHHTTLVDTAIENRANAH